MIANIFAKKLICWQFFYSYKWTLQKSYMPNENVCQDIGIFNANLQAKIAVHMMFSGWHDCCNIIKL